MHTETAANQMTMTIIVTKGSLDLAYPPFILATTAAAMGVDVTMFFTFYGLPLLLKNLDLASHAARQSGDENADDGDAYRDAERSLARYPASTPPPAR